MANNKHLTLDNRSIIESMLKDKTSFKKIGNTLEKDPTTISKEIRSRIVFRRVGGMHINYNACKLRSTCTKNHLCSTCHSERRYKLCKSCSMCNSFCKDFQKLICTRLEKAPYVCNGCAQRFSCSLEKRFYKAEDAQKEYQIILSEARSGTSLSEEEIRYLDEVITPLIKQQQSPHHICVTNRDSIMVSERTIYRLVDARILSAMNIDLPRKVRYSARKQTVHAKVDKSCRIGRDFECYLTYIKDNPDIPITQLDSVEGKKGGKVLLTIHFVKAEMMLAFLRDHNDSKSVINIFDTLYHVLGSDNFTKLFKVCLADNGTEFSNPRAIEFDKLEKQRTRIFYCNPSAPYQKGSAERNHEFIRCFIPKGTDLELYTQEDINRMMDHINSYCRERIGDKSPYDMFAFLYGKDILDLLECHRIPPQDVTLNKSIFDKGVGL
jgi:transposase, IS30 family